MCRGCRANGICFLSHCILVIRVAKKNTVRSRTGWSTLSLHREEIAGSALVGSLPEASTGLLACTHASRVQQKDPVLSSQGTDRAVVVGGRCHMIH